MFKANCKCTISYDNLNHKENLGLHLKDSLIVEEEL